MFETIAYRFHLWRLNRLSRRLHNHYRKDQKAALAANKSRAELAEIEQLEWFEVREIQHEIEQLMTRQLLKEAYKYKLPTPDWDDKEYWEEGLRKKVLTTKGIAELRAAIRKERNELWNFWELRMKVLAAILTGLTGALGAAIGFLATWRSSK